MVPALLLRGLIPAGFMPIADAGGLSIGFCPGAGPLPPAISAEVSHAAHGGHASHAAHSHHAGGGSPDPGTAHHAPCLFSTGVTAAFASAPAAATLAVPTLAAPVERPATAVFPPTVLRAQSPRAPPILA